jgi:hypothetical protein
MSIDQHLNQNTVKIASEVKLKTGDGVVRICIRAKFVVCTREELDNDLRYLSGIPEAT